MQFHQAMRAEENLAEGMSAEEAWYAARRQFGNQTLLQEVSREMWGVRSIETLFQDLRYGARMLRKSPNYALVAIFTLALGIGANTAIFTVVDATLLRGLPFKDSDRLVQVWESRRIGEIKRLDASYPDYLDWGQATEVIDGICGYTGWDGSFTLTGR